MKDITTSEIKILENEVGERRNSLSTDKLDMSFGEIISMYEREEIVIDPDFQRLFRWNHYQRTRFIESILLGIPVPPIFVAEDKEGRWELIDGLQRLSTIFSFFGVLYSKMDQIKQENNWVLGEGDLVKSLDGFTADTLPLRFKLNIRRALCRVEIIKWDTRNSQDYNMRFELFNRLNTGGSPLTDQEIRNSIFRGTSSEFNDLLKELATNQDFLDLISPTEKQAIEMYPEELVLRFISLYENSDGIHGNISQHMTQYMKKAVADREYNYKKIRDVFNRVIEVLKPVGEQAFRASNRVFSTGLYEGIMVGIAQNIDRYEQVSQEDVAEKIKELKSSEEFTKYLGSAASSKTRVANRLLIAENFFGIIDR